MTRLLKQAFEKASELPEDLQDHLALELMEELEWESQWKGSFETSQQKLEDLAKVTLHQFRSGKTVNPHEQGE